MAITLNRYECIGNLGKDPDLQVTSEGTPFTRFTVAVSMGKNAQGVDNPPLWWNVVCWRNLAEQAEKFLYKGAKVFLEGRIVPREYTDRNGQQQKAFDLVANNFQLLSEYRTGAPEDVQAGEAFLPDE